MSLIDSFYKETGMIWSGTEEQLETLILKCLLADEPKEPLIINLTND